MSTTKSSTRKSKSTSKSMSWTNSDDDEFYRQWAEQQKKAWESTIDPMAVVLNYLRQTDVPYAIIGGKAAAYHLQYVPTGSSTSMALAMSTNDYDVLIEHTHRKEFIEKLQKELRTKARAFMDEKLYESELVDIVMMGIMKNGMFDSIVDVHVLKPNAKSFPKKTIKDSSGLRYAPKDWICKELEYSIQYHASTDEITKALKRKARYELLQC